METISRKLYNALEEEGFKVRDDYSGRGMFGEQCFGYEPEYDACNIFLWMLSQLFDEGEDWEFYDEVKALIDAGSFESECSDSMGLGTIIYYPHLQVEDEEEEEDDAEEDDEEEDDE